MNPRRILVVEDNAQLNAQLSRSLKEQYSVDQVATLTGAYNFLAEARVPYDVVVLDRVLPDGDGLALLRFLQTEFPATKVCLTSHKDALQERLLGLASGADAYLAKPLFPEELSAQVGALLRRGTLVDDQATRYHDITLDTESFRCMRGDTSLKLSRRETEFLRIFLQNAQSRAEHRQFHEIFWRNGRQVSGNAVYVTIQRLRKKIQRVGMEIRVLYGYGYQLEIQPV